MGRDFQPSDQVPGSARVAILSYGFWQRRYGEDPAILGKAIRMNAASVTIVGVMPEGFSFPQKVDMWVPLVKTAIVMNRNNTDTWFAFGRLAEGVDVPTRPRGSGLHHPAAGDRISAYRLPRPPGGTEFRRVLPGRRRLA